ncbi:hypothetical protein K0O64_08810 [Mycolicibacterium pallens]|uniref:Uncharacterized protein n=1 Tax=Mycolicibacterium pallens TaxID=370524 RepID=A0ABX8VSN0_9MYCO|nr:hypothetical protein K0O64_08810 [Mycolicibacterium pallens]
MRRIDGDHSGHRRRLVVTAVLVLVGAAIVAIAISSGALRLWRSSETRPTAEQSAQDRCQTDVLKRLVSASTAHLSDVRTEASSLDVDGRDQFPLTLDEPLKGIDTARITVLNVSGVVNAPTEVGSTLQDHFDCRAYFVDGSLVHTLVLFEHEH